jgi:PAS domain S-box-containing protein
LSIASPFRTSVSIAILVIGCLAFSALGLFVIDKSTRVGADLEGTRLLAMASAAAAAMDAEDMAKLETGGREPDTPLLRHILGKLRRLRDAYPQMHFAYLMGRDKTGIHFLADAEDERSPDYSPPGQPYTEAPEAVRQAFATGRAAVAGPYYDRWGEWVSGFAPIADRTGRVVAVIGLDMAAEQWRAAAGHYRLIAQILVASVGASILFILIAFAIQHRYQRRIVQLNIKLERELAELGLANRIVENSSTLIVRFRADVEPMMLTYISRNIERYGYRPDEVLQAKTHWLELFHPQDRGLIASHAASIVSGETVSTRQELRFRRADGRWVWFSGELSPVKSADGRLMGLEGILFDITQSKHDQERIAHLTSHDPLTGLANRTSFMKRLQALFSKAKEGGTSFAVLYLDIDHFKDLNDALGHDRGDILLLAVS